MYLDQKVGVRSTDKGGPVAEALRSTDRSPFWLIYLDYINDCAFNNLPTTPTELTISFRDKIAFITEETFLKELKNTEFRVHLLLSQNRAHFKNSLNRVKPFFFALRISYSSVESINSVHSYKRLRSAVLWDTIYIPTNTIDHVAYKRYLDATDGLLFQWSSFVIRTCPYFPRLYLVHPCGSSWKWLKTFIVLRIEAWSTYPKYDTWGWPCLNMERMFYSALSCEAFPTPKNR